MKIPREMTNAELISEMENLENALRDPVGCYTDHEQEELNMMTMRDEILVELDSRKNIFSEAEYNALDYYMTTSKLYDSGFYIRQKNGIDGFYDEDDEAEYDIKEGLKIVYDSVIDIEGLPIEVQTGLKSAFKRILDIEV